MGVSLRPDTVVREVGEAGLEAYLTEMPPCCLGTLKRNVMSPGAPIGYIACGVCGRGWEVVSSLDERIVEKFPVETEVRGTG